MKRPSVVPWFVLVTTVFLSACAGDARDGADAGAGGGPSMSQPAASGEPTDDGIDTAAGGPASSDSVTLVFARGEEAASVRRAATAPADVHQALALLVRGPTAAEEAAGLDSWFSAQTASALRSIDVDADGHAVVDFEGLDTLIPNASSSAGSRLLLMQLNGTVFQFPEVESVEYRLNGSCDAFGEWLQTGCVTHGRAGGT